MFGSQKLKNGAYEEKTWFDFDFNVFISNSWQHYFDKNCTTNLQFSFFFLSFSTCLYYLDKILSNVDNKKLKET